MKATVREKMDMFTNGELKPSDDPDMVAPVKDLDQPSNVSNDNKAKLSAAASVIDNTVDEFKDKEGLHYKVDMKATSKTPGPNLINTGSVNMV